MNPLKSFKEFEISGKVRRQQPDIERSKSLCAEAINKKNFFEKVINKVTLKEVDPNFIIETSYDIIMELIRSKLYLEGYNPGNSHEA